MNKKHTPEEDLISRHLTHGGHKCGETKHNQIDQTRLVTWWWTLWVTQNFMSILSTCTITEWLQIHRKSIWKVHFSSFPTDILSFTNHSFGNSTVFKDTCAVPLCNGVAMSHSHTLVKVHKLHIVNVCVTQTVRPIYMIVGMKTLRTRIYNTIKCNKWEIFG